MAHLRQLAFLAEPTSPSKGLRWARLGHICCAGLGTLALAGCTSTSNPKPKPSPVQTHVGSHTLTINATSGCPSVALGTVKSRGSKSSTIMAPRHPSGALACRYGAITATGAHLISSARISASSADRIAALLDKLSVARGVVACPSDSGARDVVVFTYAGKPDAEVQIGLSGCQTVTNGHMSATATPSLANLLATTLGSAG